jgi:hypothetical protein
LLEIMFRVFFSNQGASRLRVSSRGRICEIRPSSISSPARASTTFEDLCRGRT